MIRAALCFFQNVLSVSVVCKCNFQETRLLICNNIKHKTKLCQSHATSLEVKVEYSYHLFIHPSICLFSTTYLVLDHGSSRIIEEVKMSFSLQPHIIKLVLYMCVTVYAVIVSSVLIVLQFSVVVHQLTPPP